MTYRDCLVAAQTKLAQDPQTLWVGYNVRYGPRFGGSLDGVPDDRKIEMPLAEALMTGCTIGLSLAGYIPILCFERMDFLLLALDQIVNHLDKLEELSGGSHKPAVILRCVVGNSQSPLFTGVTHTRNHSVALRALVKFPVRELLWPTSIVQTYNAALNHARDGISTCLVEMKDLYSEEIVVPHEP